MPNIIQEMHEATHEAGDKTIHRIKQVFRSKGLTKIVREFVSHCHTCEQHKNDQKLPKGLLSPLPIPNQIWEYVSMDFVEGLPSSEGKQTILVVVDRLSKCPHFLPLKYLYIEHQVAQIFCNNVYKLHGHTKSIVSDLDPIFVSRVVKEFFWLQRATSNFSSSYHPQTEVTNPRLEMATLFNE